MYAIRSYYVRRARAGRGEVVAVRARDFVDFFREAFRRDPGFLHPGASLANTAGGKLKEGADG